MLMQPCKRPRPSPPPYHRVTHDRLEIDKRHISRHAERSQYIPRQPTQEIPHINNPDPRYSAGHSNHDDSHCQDLRVMLQSQSWDIRKSPDVVEPRFPPGFESIVKNSSPPNKDVHDGRDETPPNTDRVEEGEILSTITKQIRSAIFGCVQHDEQGNDDEAPPLCVTRESTHNVGGPDMVITKYDFKGDDIEAPIHVTEGLTKDVAELQVKNTDCDNLLSTKESARDGDDQLQKPPATHEVPPIDDNDVAVDSIMIPQVNNGTRHHEALENSFEDEVFNQMGDTEMVKEIIDAWKQYTCTRVRLEEVKQEEHKQIQKLDHLMSLLVKNHMN